MVNTLEVSLKSRSACIGVALAALLAVLPATAAAQGAAQAASQTEERSRWSFLATSGNVVPTGVQEESLGRGRVSAAQVSYDVRPALALGTTVAWARANGRGVLEGERFDVFMYDIGAELRVPHGTTTRKVTVRPFIGGGAGSRAYNYRDTDTATAHKATAYVSTGVEVGIRRVQLRVDVRNYVSGFSSIRRIGAGDTRNDVVVMTGVRIVR